MALTICTAGDTFRQNLGDLLIAVEGARPQEPLFDKFYRMLAESQNEASDINLLDVGGRARSGVLVSEAHRHWNVTVLDIVADQGVDVVADAHTMSNILGSGGFDGVMSISVFEHLLMPWKAAIEIGKVLKIGGLAAVHTHQTIGLHDMPWDFYRFSDASWPGLFNQATGFEIIETQVSQYMHVIPQLYRPEFADAENAGGWRTSAVLARKICEPRVDWDVDLFDALQTSYPLHSEAAVTRGLS